VNYDGRLHKICAPAHCDWVITNRTDVLENYFNATVKVVIDYRLQFVNQASHADIDAVAPTWLPAFVLGSSEAASIAESHINVGDHLAGHEESLKACAEEKVLSDWRLCWGSQVPVIGAFPTRGRVIRTQDSGLPVSFSNAHLSTLSDQTRAELGAAVGPALTSVWVSMFDLLFLQARTDAYLVNDGWSYWPLEFGSSLSEMISEAPITSPAVPA
jgi:hypothetical protein